MSDGQARDPLLVNNHLLHNKQSIDDLEKCIDAFPTVDASDAKNAPKIFFVGMT